MTDTNLAATALDVLRALAVQIRFVTQEQLTRGWFYGRSNASAESMRVIEFLAHRGLIDRARIEVRDSDPVAKPLFAWRPGEPDPSPRRWEQLAAHLAARWSERFTTHEVLFASPAAANFFGAKDAGTGRPCEWSHDYRLTEVYLRYRAVEPKAIACWQGELARSKWGKQVPRMKDPDAMLLDDTGTIQRIIEVAGKYSAEHLADLHNHCAGDGYERLDAWQQRLGTPLPNNPYELVEIGYELW